MEALDVDEVDRPAAGDRRLRHVEDVAYVDAGELAHIEGFDEDTAKEIQTRAREFLERQEAERDAKRKELGVADDLAKIQGVTPAMLVALGEHGIKTLEDLAGCATDDLIGWTERKKEKDAEPVRHKGVLEGFEVEPQGGRRHDHGGAHRGGLGDGGGPREDARRAGGGSRGSRGCQGSRSRARRTPRSDGRGEERNIGGRCAKARRRSAERAELGLAAAVRRLARPEAA